MHAKVTGQGRSRCARNKGDGGVDAKAVISAGDANQDGDHDDEHRKPLVLGLQECCRAVLDLLGNVLHGGGAIRTLHDGGVLDEGKDQGGEARGTCDLEEIHSCLKGWGRGDPGSMPGKDRNGGFSDISGQEV